MIESKNMSIDIQQVSKIYHGNKGIFDINIAFSHGFLNLITGKNGSGKSTLLKCIMKLVKYKGKISKRRVKIGYAPENYIMPEFLTVNEFLYNIGRIKGLDKDTYKENSFDYFRFFEIENYKNKAIKTLSNGTKQKVNLIQALIHEPKIVILDEPLVTLDYNSQKKLTKYLIELAKEKLVIISTHHPEKFNTKTKKIYNIENGRINV